jgi:hypothetical protein
MPFRLLQCPNIALGKHGFFGDFFVFVKAEFFLLAFRVVERMVRADEYRTNQTEC